jgi:lipoprotein-anchoring transpeptidase ErfK/SrfK
MPSTPATQATTPTPATPPAQAAATPPTATAADAAPAQAANNAALTPVVGPSSKGDATLRAQILLDRANFGPGEIDGAFGSNLARAINGFQANAGLPVTGRIDAATWAALDKDSAPVLVRYTVTAADVAGPFNPIPSDMMEKATLPALGYTSALEGLGEKFHASPKLLQQLNPSATFSTAGESLVVPAVANAAPIGTVDKVVVDKSDSTVSLVDAAGKTLAQFPASTGSIHDPLPVGDWKIQGVARDPSFNYNPDLFWDANPAHGKAKIPAGPNNPVGVVWVDLSKPHYGIHGTPEPSKIGKTESHGCIRLTNWNAQVVAKHAKAGMTALLQD